MVKIWSDPLVQFYLDTTLRLVIACLLGGVIGFERENTRRPAGLRTHILVCVGACLVMIISEYFRDFRGYVNTDPTRLGAQVISGIGFLGAGTIIREGLEVKGLTTAAGIWAVACVGLAVGGGFYLGAIITTILISGTLVLFKRIEEHIIKRKKRYSVIYIRTTDCENNIPKINKILLHKGIIIKSVDFIEKDVTNCGLVRFVLKIPYSIKKGTIMDSIRNLDDMEDVY